MVTKYMLPIAKFNKAYSMARKPVSNRFVKFRDLNVQVKRKKNELKLSIVLGSDDCDMAEKVMKAITKV